jgi:hypothetical protein
LLKRNSELNNGEGGNNEVLRKLKPNKKYLKVLSDNDKKSLDEIFGGRKIRQGPSGDILQDSNDFEE